MVWRPLPLYAVCNFWKYASSWSQPVQAQVETHQHRTVGGEFVEIVVRLAVRRLQDDLWVQFRRVLVVGTGQRRRRGEARATVRACAMRGTLRVGG